ncbi:hypothetical protein ACFL35_03945 [Candidatus Riflebacteria bacterium]
MLNFLGLNHLVNKNWGVFIELFGGSQAFSLLSCHFARHQIDNGGRVLWLNSGKIRSHGELRQLGIIPDGEYSTDFQFLILEPTTFKEAMNIFNVLIFNESMLKKPTLVVIDQIFALQPEWYAKSNRDSKGKEMRAFSAFLQNLKTSNKKFKPRANYLVTNKSRTIPATVKDLPDSYGSRVTHDVFNIRIRLRLEVGEDFSNGTVKADGHLNCTLDVRKADCKEMQHQIFKVALPQDFKVSPPEKLN